MTVRKTLQRTSIPTGKDQAPFLLSQDACSLQVGKALAENQKSGNECASLGFQVRLVSDGRLLLSQIQFKGSRAPKPHGPSTGSVGGAYSS